MGALTEPVATASLDMLAHVAAALQTHHRDIKVDRDYAFEQLRNAMLEQGLKRHETADVVVEIVKGRKYAIRTERAHTFKLVCWPYVKVTVRGEKRPAGARA